MEIAWVMKTVWRDSSVVVVAATHPMSSLMANVMRQCLCFAIRLSNVEVTPALDH